MLGRLSEWFKGVGLLFFTLGYLGYRLLWRVVESDRPHAQRGNAVLYAHWHGDELLLVPVFAYKRMAVLVSRSSDGNLMQWLLRWMGYKVVRGSSTRGGVGGLKGLIDAVRSGRDASLAVDGPRGPIYKVKPGILKLAQETGAVIIPGASAASKKYVFKKAWNKCYFPLPFSKCVIVYGNPIVVQKEISVLQFEELRKGLEDTLISLKDRAEGLCSVGSVLGVKRAVQDL